MNPVIEGAMLGIGATLVLDAWGLLRRPVLHQPRPDYALVGRWAGHLLRGRLHHRAIAGATPIRGEAALGWVVHYVVGIGLGIGWVLLAPGWPGAPTPLPALAYGLATVALPWLVMQPAMGAGIAAARTRDPRAARLQSLATHSVFGLGLWFSGCALHLARLG